jgi:RNA polymerase sigma-70 factor (ECF subfamily)
MDETALIDGAQKGDLDAFNRLVLAYQEQIYNQALRMLDDPAPAEDASQEAFLLAYRHLRTFRGGSFRAWLLRIVTNVCYDELRRRKRRPTTPLEPVDDDGEEIESPGWMVDSGDTPEEAADRSALGKAIQHCLNELPDEFRTVVLLVDVQGMNYDEASLVIGKPLGTVKSRLARARSRLQNCLRGFRELLPAQFRLERE